MSQPSRRTLVAGAAAAAGAGLFPARVLSAAPPAATITPDLVAMAKKEGRVNFYTAMDLTVATPYAKMFEAAYPGISVKVERAGSERVFSRIAQEYASNIHNVDIVNSTDASHVYHWKSLDWLAPFVTSDIASHIASDYKDPDGTWATVRVLFCAIGYNTELVKKEDAPKGFRDLLDPKWQGKLVKAHPGYSGVIMTATFAIARDLGWEYFEALAKQKVLQVQSAVDPPKKIALGERAVMADGGDYNLLQHKDKGSPVELVYPVEGAPIINSPNAIFKAAPNPNAARLFQAWMFSAEGQQRLVDLAAQYVPHAQAKPKPGRPALKDIKIMRDDPAALLKVADEIKTRYTAIFKV
ncbi:MAG: extracellular solute-binding protein [Proteobacteria bacterium]|nr:extracellular solute-binding protein [Pseudomonadota bacterium]